MTPPTRPHSSGITRRESLQVGYSGLLGLGLSSLMPGQAAADEPRSPGRRKSVIVVFLTGGASHLDTFDPKPDAPPEIRGEFQPIATRTPGLTVSEHLPRLAARADKFAVVRSLSHRENNHLMATHHVLTGHPQPGAFFDKVASRDDWPCYAAGLNYTRPAADGTPAGVNLPTFLMEGPLTWPGQHAGFLGARHDPWQVTRDPNAPDFRVDALRLDPAVAIDRLGDRRTLLEQIDQQQTWLADVAETRRLADKQEQAFSLLTSGRVAQAFDIDREPLSTRERYGRHAFGQSILLARRLVQAGVPVVQANMGRVQNWDTHGENFTRLKNQLLPPVDQGVAALLDDLEATGLIDDTLVLVLTEFGRSPKINNAGRDHWASCFSGLFAGAGVRGGQVIGRSDKIGGFPVTVPYAPDDIGATVYHVLGVDPEAHIRDKQGRPSQLNRGRVIGGLFGAATG
jgi:uncharacterized protein (DUF1501 family)